MMVPMHAHDAGESEVAAVAWKYAGATPQVCHPIWRWHFERAAPVGRHVAGPAGIPNRIHRLRLGLCVNVPLGAKSFEVLVDQGILRPRLTFAWSCSRATIQRMARVQQAASLPSHVLSLELVLKKSDTCLLFWRSWYIDINKNKRRLDCQQTCGNRRVMERSGVQRRQCGAKLWWCKGNRICMNVFGANKIYTRAGCGRVYLGIG